MTQIDKLMWLTAGSLVLTIALCGVMFGVWLEIDKLARQIQELGKLLSKDCF